MIAATARDVWVFVAGCGFAFLACIVGILLSQPGDEQ